MKDQLVEQAFTILHAIVARLNARRIAVEYPYEDAFQIALGDDGQQAEVTLQIILILRGEALDRIYDAANTIAWRRLGERAQTEPAPASVVDTACKVLTEEFRAIVRDTYTQLFAGFCTYPVTVEDGAAELTVLKPIAVPVTVTITLTEADLALAALAGLAGLAEMPSA